MKPHVVQLPDIWRGCLYPAIYFYWRDRQGNPFNLNGWVPLCYGKNFSFNVQVINLLQAQTRIVMDQNHTAALKLGKQSWDFVWVTGPTIYPPVLTGVVTVRDPLSDTSPVPIDDNFPDGPVSPDEPSTE